MSFSAKYHATMWAEGKTPEQIQTRIAEIIAYLAKPYNGCGLDDDRLYHGLNTEMATLREILNSR